MLLKYFGTVHKYYTKDIKRMNYSLLGKVRLAKHTCKYLQNTIGIRRNLFNLKKKNKNAI